MTAIERTAYPRLDERLSGIELVAKFELTIADRAFIARAARGPTNQLTLAMLLRARQAFGLFLAPSNISDAIRSHMAAQLGLSEATEIMRGRQVLHRYRLLIRAHLAVSAYGEAGEKIVVQTTFAAATTMSDPADLINRAIEALIAAHIDLPAFSALDRVVNHVRAQVHRRIYSEVGERLASDQATVLDALLIVDPQTGITPFNRLKHSPGPARPSNIRDWTERLAWIDKLPDPAPVLRDITFTKLRQFAAETAALEVGELLDISSADKRRTFLLSLINQSKTRCRDELAEMFLIRVRRTQAAAKEKLADLRKRHQGLEESLIAVLSQILVTAQETDADAALGQSIKALFQKRGGVDHLSEQCATVSAWHGDNVLPLLWPIHAQTRSLLFEILDQLEIQSATQDQSLVLAMRRVVKLRRSRRPDIMDPPDLSFASQRWVTFMKEGRGDGVDRKAFEVCVFVYVAHGLQSGDLFVVGSETYSDYRAQLLPWSECAPKLDAYCAAIGRPNTAPAFVEQLKEALTTAAQNVDRGFPDNAELTIDAKGEPHLKRARAAPVPKAMGAFEREIRSRMPERHLLDILKNAEHWSDYTRHFGPPSGSDPKLSRAVQRYLFAVFGYGCNLGPAQTARHAPDIASAQTLRRINAQHVDVAKLEAAMSDIINAYAAFPLPKLWGSGKAVISDGTHAPLRENNLIGACHIRYGGYGAIAYHHVSDTYVALFTTFISCGVWEAVHIFDGLLKNRSTIQPDTLHADTHGQSEPVFGFGLLLGVQLMPRMRTWADVTLYRPTKSVRYEHIDALFTDQIDWPLITRHWRDMMQVVISIQSGRVTPSTLLRKLGVHNRKSLLYQAFRELGRVQRTLFLLTYISDPEVRKNIQAQTTKVEAFNDFLDWVTFGGPIIKSGDPVEQEKQIKYASLVANTVMLSNVSDLTSVLTTMIDDGHHVTPELVAQLSPYIREHIRRFGKFVLDMEDLPGPLNPKAIPFAATP
jgi:TnpA family transposase